MTEGPGRGARAVLSPTPTPTQTPSSPVHFNPLFPVTSRAEEPLQPGGGVGKLEGRAVLATPHSPRVTRGLLMWCD